MQLKINTIKKKNQQSKKLRSHLSSKKINGWWNWKQILILWIILNKKNKKIIKFERKINWCVALKIYRVRRVKWEEEKEKRKRKEKVANTKTKIPLPHVLHKNDGDAVKIQTLSWKSLTSRWRHTCCIEARIKPHYLMWITHALTFWY
jgi:hypothetical protein